LLKLVLANDLELVVEADVRGTSAMMQTATALEGVHRFGMHGRQKPQVRPQPFNAKEST
jgi:hypothetical protein